MRTFALAFRDDYRTQNTCYRELGSCWGTSILLDVSLLPWSYPDGEDGAVLYREAGGRAADTDR